jgi:hypothetical protein
LLLELELELELLLLLLLLLVAANAQDTASAQDSKTEIAGARHLVMVALLPSETKIIRISPCFTQKLAKPGH